ncbi:hypothetical protein [Chitinibacter tainanensis]|uniref:hypothetical protein n=1 Tax=Chitinibacter tainanensis TaxID=230667 RepID=UPI00048D0096|nr:hypothetical protein [Chitinibacter tainanensis]
MLEIQIVKKDMATGLLEVRSNDGRTVMIDFVGMKVAYPELDLIGMFERTIDIQRQMSHQQEIAGVRRANALDELANLQVGASLYGSVTQEELYDYAGSREGMSPTLEINYRQAVAQINGQLMSMMNAELFMTFMAQSLSVSDFPLGTSEETKADLIRHQQGAKLQVAAAFDLISSQKRRVDEMYRQGDAQGLASYRFPMVG